MSLQPIDEFFETDDFAVDATYTPDQGTAKTITVIFDAPFAIVEANGIEFQNAAPTVLCKSTDVSDATEGATVAISGTTYEVKEVQPDGTGITRLILAKEESA